MIEPVLTRRDTNKKHVSDKGLKDFFDYCCVTRHYFSLSKSVVKRDVYASLYVCLNVSLEKTKHLPDPMLGEKDHYLPFRGAFKKKITERDRPSLAHKILTRSQNPYHSQHVYNTSTISESCCKVKNATEQTGISLDKNWLPCVPLSYIEESGKVNPCSIKERSWCRPCFWKKTHLLV